MHLPIQNRVSVTIPPTRRWCLVGFLSKTDLAANGRCTVSAINAGSNSVVDAQIVFR